MNSNSEPSPAGVQASWITPFGTYTNANLRGASFFNRRDAANAGTIASRKGNAIAVPVPRRNIRRSSWAPKTIAIRFASYHTNRVLLRLQPVSGVDPASLTAVG